MSDPTSESPTTPRPQDVRKMSAPSSLTERHRANEAVLTEHFGAFERVGHALTDIRESKSYKLVDGFDTFEAYCKDKWQMTDRNARRLMRAADLVPNLPSPKKSGPIGSTWRERSVRELMRLRTDRHAKTVAAAVVEEVDDFGRKLTVGLVRKHVDKWLGVDRSDPRAEWTPPQFEAVVLQWTGEIAGVANQMDSAPDDVWATFRRDYSYRAKCLDEAFERLAKSVARTAATVNAKPKRRVGKAALT